MHARPTGQPEALHQPDTGRSREALDGIFGQDDRARAQEVHPADHLRYNDYDLPLSPTGTSSLMLEDL